MKFTRGENIIVSFRINSLQCLLDVSGDAGIDCR